MHFWYAARSTWKGTRMRVWSSVPIEVRKHAFSSFCRSAVLAPALVKTIIPGSEVVPQPATRAKETSRPPTPVAALSEQVPMSSSLRVVDGVRAAGAILSATWPPRESPLPGAPRRLWYPFKWHEHARPPRGGLPRPRREPALPHRPLHVCRPHALPEGRAALRGGRPQLQALPDQDGRGGDHRRDGRDAADRHHPPRGGVHGRHRAPHGARLRDERGGPDGLRALRDLFGRGAPHREPVPGPGRPHPPGLHRAPANPARVGTGDGPAPHRLALLARHLPPPRLPRQKPLVLHLARSRERSPSKPAPLAVRLLARGHAGGDVCPQDPPAQSVEPRARRGHRPPPTPRAH